MTQPWNMAKAANRRPLPKPIKMHGPVGQKMIVSDHIKTSGRRFAGSPGHGEYAACQGCGYHVCSCTLESLTKKLDETMNELVGNVRRFGRYPDQIPELGMHAGTDGDLEYYKSIEQPEHDFSSYEKSCGKAVELPTDPEARAKAIRLLTTGSCEDVPQSGTYVALRLEQARIEMEAQSKALDNLREHIWGHVKQLKKPLPIEAPVPIMVGSGYAFTLDGLVKLP